MLCFQKGKVSVPNVLNIFLSLEIHYSNMVPGAVYLYDFFFPVIFNCIAGGNVTAIYQVKDMKATIKS